MTGLRTMRRRAGLKQYELADRLGVTRQAVNAWELGRAVPSSKKMPQIAQTLGCQLEDLYAPPPEATKENYTQKEEEIP